MSSADAAVEQYDRECEAKKPKTIEERLARIEAKLGLEE
jgi:hypothetical protein